MKFRAVIDDAAFAALVAGKRVTVSATALTGERGEAELILSDIGWRRMLLAIAKAMEGQD